MAKIRQPLTAAYAVQRAIDAVPLTVLADAVGKSAGLVYKWSDPDEPNEISVAQALVIDDVVAELSADRPFRALFDRNAGEAEPLPPLCLRDCVLQMTAAMGALSAGVLEATNPRSDGGANLTAAERQGLLVMIETFRRQLDDAERAVLPKKQEVAA